MIYLGLIDEEFSSTSDTFELRLSHSTNNFFIKLLCKKDSVKSC